MTEGSGNPTNSTAGILVVDDNEQNLELLMAYLEPLGIPLDGARDGATAIERARSNTPSLILLDIMMPRMSGFQVCETLKADPTTKDIPIIVVTALTEEGDAERARDAGADAFVTKPVDRQELLDLVRAKLPA